MRPFGNLSQHIYSSRFIRGALQGKNNFLWGNLAANNNPNVIELLFVDPQGRLNAAPVHWTKNGTPSFGLPALLDVPRVGYGHWGTNYDTSADGRRVYMLRQNTDRGPSEIHVVLGWRALF